MKKDSVPSCRRDGEFVDIQKDSQSTLCDIQSKRIDANWSDWAEAETVVDTASEFKEVKRRSLLLEEAHGGIPGKCNFQMKQEFKTFSIQQKCCLLARFFSDERKI